MGDLDEAIDFYHQALSCKPDDPFSSEMLNKALQEALSTGMALGEDENNIPHNTPSVDGRGPSGLKDQDGKDDLGFQSNVSASMTSDDGLNLSVESDVDMSMA